MDFCRCTKLQSNFQSCYFSTYNNKLSLLVDLYYDYMFRLKFGSSYCYNACGNLILVFFFNLYEINRAESIKANVNMQ